MKESPEMAVCASIALASMLSVCTPVAAAAQSRVIVGDPTITVPKGDTVAERGRLLVQAFASGLQNEGQCPNVVTSVDVKDRLDFEKLKLALGSGNEAAANRVTEELAATLAADTVVSLSVGAVGATYVLSASAIVKGQVVARVSEVSRTQDDLGNTADRAGVRLGRALGCKVPDPIFFEGTLTYEVTLDKAESKTNEAGDTSSLQTRAHRKDTIEVRGLRDSAGRADIDETSTSRLVTPTRLSQCAAPGGYRDLPNSSNQSTEMVTTGGGATSPSVRLQLDGARIQVSIEAFDSLPRTMKQRDTVSGVTCGRPHGPETTTHSTDAVTTALDTAAVVVNIPFTRGQAQQSGAKTWPIEVNDLKGTATLTWKLIGKS